MLPRIRHEASGVRRPSTQQRPPPNSARAEGLEDAGPGFAPIPVGRLLDLGPTVEDHRRPGDEPEDHDPHAPARRGMPGTARVLESWWYPLYRFRQA